VQLQIDVPVQHWNIPNLPKTKITENKRWSATIINCVFHLFQKVLLVRLLMAEFIKCLFSIEFLLMAEWIIPSLRKPSNHQVTAISSHIIHVLPNIVLPLSTLNQVCSFECQSCGNSFWELWWSPGNFVIRTGCYVAHLFPTCNRCIILSPPTYNPTPQNRLLPFCLWLCGIIQHWHYHLFQFR
jgi:hypothetical protein